MKKLYIISMVLLSGSLADAQTHRSIVPVFAQEYPDKIFVTQPDLQNYLTEFNVKAEINDRVVQKHKKKYFLLARDEKKGTTYAFRLRRVHAEYCLIITDKINSCDCSMDINKFTFQKNKIIGCAGYYSTAGIY
jgi:hypothetical protein